MNHWDKKHKRNFDDILRHKIGFIPADDGHEWYFDLKDTKRLYFDELAFMIEYLEAIGEMRFKVNATKPRE